VTRCFDSARAGSGGGLFRPGDHVLVLEQGSALAILDLERGVVYATTPFGAESWNVLVGSTDPRRRAVRESRSSGCDNEEGREGWARFASYLFDRRIIEPITR
jgi:hypothetical protein